MTMNTIEVRISSEAVTNFDRVARHEAFVITPDLEMIQQVRVITLDEHGTPILERIANDDQLTPAQREQAARRYQDQVVTKQTAGAFVNAAGQVVAPDAEGAIRQRDYFQRISLGDLKAMGVTITDETSVASLIYLLVRGEIAKIDARGEL